MPYCPNCGVKVDKGVEKCPLCNFDIPAIDQDDGKKFKKYPDKIDRYPKSYRRKRKIFMSYYNFMALVLSIIFLIEDFVFTGGITWSKYVIVPVLYTTYFLRFIFGLTKGYHRGLLTVHLGTFVMVFLLDIFNGEIDFSLTLALPLLVVSYFGIEVFSFISKKTKKFGLDSVAYILIFFAFLLIALEFVVELKVYSIIDLDWSLIAAFQLIPIAFFMFLLHNGSTENFKRNFKHFIERLMRKFHT